MNYEQARNAIQAHVAANWSGTAPGTIAYDNLPFDKPSDAPWVRLAIRHNDGFAAALGNKRFRRTGIQQLADQS